MQDLSQKYIQTHLLKYVVIMTYVESDTKHSLGVFNSDLPNNFFPPDSQETRLYFMHLDAQLLAHQPLLVEIGKSEGRHVNH